MLVKRIKLSDGLILTFILIIGLILRLKSIWFGYPLVPQTDERFLIETAEISYEIAT
jgi:hypothetical protein